MTIINLIIRTCISHLGELQAGSELSSLQVTPHGFRVLSVWRFRKIAQDFVVFQI